MRAAQALHSWRRVTTDWSGNASFKGLSSRTDSGFSASGVVLSGGLLLVAGANSVGKSRLLRSIWAERHRPEAAFTELTWMSAEPDEYSYVDLFELMTRQWQAVQSSDVGEQVEAAGLTALRPNQVKLLSYVIGRNYESIRVAELEATDPFEETAPGASFRPDVVPFFEVVAGGRTYKSEQLSRGELSALTLFWVLQSAEPGTMLLLDEPDLMMSPMSARRALDMIVDDANTRKVPVAIATHSYLGLAETPRSAQVLLRVNSSGESLLASADDYALWEVLRVAAPTRLVFVVEDRMAQLLMGIFLDAIAFPHLDETGIWIGGDSSKVALVGKLPEFAEASSVMWGVLDGNEKSPRSELRLLRLPGGDSPEEGAIRVCSEMPSLISSSSEAIERALERSIGDDPHDRVGVVARALGISPEELVGRAWRGWISETEQGATALRLFADDLLRVTESLERLRR